MQNNTKALSVKNTNFSSSLCLLIITQSYAPLKRLFKYHFYEYKSTEFYCPGTLDDYLPIIC